MCYPPHGNEAPCRLIEHVHRHSLTPVTQRKVILHSISVQSDRSHSLSQGLAWPMSMRLMIQDQKSVFAGPLNTNNTLRLHLGNVTCLKTTHPYYIQHNPRVFFFSPQSQRGVNSLCFKHNTKDNAADKRWRSRWVRPAGLMRRRMGEMQSVALRKNTPCAHVQCLYLILCPDSRGHLVLT